MRIRHADDRDCQSIVRFVQATLQGMESVGGHEVNHDKIFWQRYGEKIVEFIRKGDRLYLFAQTGSKVLGYLEGKIIKLHNNIVFVLCIENKDCDDLEKRKVYQVLPDDKAADEGYLRIVDESGEDYLYPESYFIPVELPRKVQDALRMPK